MEKGGAVSERLFAKPEYQTYNRPIVENATRPRPIALLWAGLALFAASAILYLTNDWPCGSPVNHPDVDLKWPLVYTATTVVFLFLLVVANQEPPSKVRQWVDGYVSARRTTALFHVAGLVFYAITSVALVRRLAASGWQTGEMAVAMIVVGCAALLIWSAFRPVSLGRTFLAVAVGGLVLRLAAFWLNPLAVDSSDMLPLIKAADESLLAGSNPYRLYDLHTWSLPLPYLPGTWLAYLPAVAAGLDLRLVNALAELVILGALALGQHSQAQDAMPVGVLIAMLIYLSPSIIIFDLYTEHPIFWMLIVVLLTLLSAGRNRAAALTWGIALASSPFTLVISPFVALHLARATPPRRWWRLAVLTGAPLLALLAPFVAWDSQSFFYGTFTWLNDLDIVGRSAWAVHGRQQLFAIGLAGWFWYAGWERILKPVQAVLLLVVFAHYWRHSHRAGQLLRSSLWACTLFVCFNIVIWPRYYAPVLCLAALSVISRLSPRCAAAATPAAC